MLLSRVASEAPGLELGMVALVGSQIWWTWEVIDVFRRVKNGQDKMAMKLLSDKLTLQLADLTKLVSSDFRRSV